MLLERWVFLAAHFARRRSRTAGRPPCCRCSCRERLVHGSLGPGWLGRLQTLAAWLTAFIGAVFWRPEVRGGVKRWGAVIVAPACPERLEDFP